MGDVLDQAAALVQCKECPWYKSCVVPLRLTTEDMRKQWEGALPGMGMPPGAETGMHNLLAGLASAAQNAILEGCPIFIERLRASPKLAQRIKEMMQTWGNKEEGS
ncbi:MAG: hypothetical protein Q8O76_06885 [Chloroflexota bacterium]|nr:hypothetical protein [Chloroflexota bacterium]